MPDFESILNAVVARPGMYVGFARVRVVATYLDGYAHALDDAGHPHAWRGLSRWVEMRFLISHPAWHWSRILVHVYGDDRAALAALPGLYREFHAFVTEHGLDGLDREHDRRFVEAYGDTSSHAPRQTHTADP